jgi:hypothetical protein
MSSPPTGILFYEPRAKPLSTTGTLQPGAYYQFYVTQTTTPTNVYADGGLTTPLSQTPGTGGTTAASDGRLVPIYMDPNVIYRVQLYSSTGTLLEDTDPYVNTGTPSQSAIGQALWPQTSAESAASVTPTFYYYPPGDIRRYGASPSNPDNGPNINNALKCNPIVYDGNTNGPVLYPIQTTIRFRAAGQIFKGAGMGDSNTVGGAGAVFAPRTTLKWTGSAGGKVVSTSDGTNCYSETELRDIFIDGNSLAQYGVEGFDDSLAISGCWRNRYINVGIMNCTTCAYYMGNGSGANGKPFANDNYLENCYLWNSVRGIFGAGAVPQIHHCTIGNNSTAGMHLKGQGSEAKVYGGIFHNNAWDIIADNGATTGCQNVTAIGTWFENSTSGIYLTNASHSLHMIGCHLHTFSGTCMFNFNNQAGAAVIKCWAAAGASSYGLINTNPAYDYDVLGSGIAIDAGYSIRATQAGGAIRADNSAFFVGLASSTANNVTGDGTQYSFNTTGVNVFYNLGSNVNTSTGVFTAPYDGYYLFTVQVEFTNVTSSHNDAQLLLNVGGNLYTMDRRNPGTQLEAGSTQAHIAGTVQVQVLKGTACYPVVSVNGSTKTVGILSSNLGTNWRTSFSGRMM